MAALLRNVSLANNGDLLEVHYADFISARISSYEQIWRIYVGHDGKGNYIDIPLLEPAEKKKRQKVCEAHYTCLESIIGMMRILEKSKKRIAEAKRKLNLDEYIDLQNDFVAFHGHMGRIRDMLKDIGVLLGDQTLYKYLDDYYKKVWVPVIHGRKIVFYAYENEYEVTLPDEEYKYRTWENATGQKKEFLTTMYEKYFDDVVNGLNNALSNALTPIKQEVKRLKLDIAGAMEKLGPEAFDYTPDSAPTSGAPANLKYPFS